MSFVYCCLFFELLLVLYSWSFSLFASPFCFPMVKAILVFGVTVLLFPVLFCQPLLSCPHRVQTCFSCLIFFDQNQVFLIILLCPLPLITLCVFKPTSCFRFLLHYTTFVWLLELPLVEFLDSVCLMAFWIFGFTLIKYLFSFL